MTLRFYASGSKLSSCSYVDNVLHGLCEVWYENGQLYSQLQYEHGKPVGVCHVWKPDGSKWLTWPMH